MARVRSKEPTFGKKCLLARYVDDFNGDHAAATVFMLDATDRATPDKVFLSVDSAEISRIKKIVDDYRALFRIPRRQKVPVATHKVIDYVLAARHANLQVNEHAELKWSFVESDADTPAFLRRDGATVSHCGVEFLRGFQSETQEMNFARQMAKRPKFHLY